MSEELKQPTGTVSTEGLGDIVQAAASKQEVPVTDFARSKGHISREEWERQGRDPGLYIDEETWVKNYTWLNQINQLKKEASEQKKALEYLVEQNKKAEQLGRQKVIEELKKQQIEAAASGDVEKVTKITEQLVEEQKKPAHTESVDVAVKSFTERNKSWFNDSTPENIAAKAYAIAREDSIAKAHPDIPVAARLKMVEDEVKSKFLANASILASPSVSTTKEAPVKKDEYDLSSLPKYHQDMALRLQKSTRNFDLKAYIRQVKEIEQAGMGASDFTLR